MPAVSFPTLTVSLQQWWPACKMSATGDMHSLCAGCSLLIRNMQHTTADRSGSRKKRAGDWAGSTEYRTESRAADLKEEGHCICNTSVKKVIPSCFICWLMIRGRLIDEITTISQVRDIFIYSWKG